MKKLQNQPHYFLGIDGGATKTDMVLTDEQETILARHYSGPTNLHTISEKEIINNLHDGLQALFKKAKLNNRTQLTAIGAGFAGLDNKKLHDQAYQLLKKAFAKHLPKQSKRLQVVNDTIIGFWSGITDQEGICLIGGTGSNCYGRDKKGKEAWANGLDWKLSDEGSGWEQGWKALRAVVKSYDGRGPKTTLEKVIYKHYKIKTARELLPIVYNDDYSKHDIGQLALFVEEEALIGDKIAKQICFESANELLLSLKAVASKLQFKKSQEFPIVLIGGVIQRNPLVQKRFKKLVRQNYPKAKFILPKVKPAMGAIRLAISSAIN